VVEKELSRLAKGEIGFTLSDGKTIMACLQQFVIKQQCEAYLPTSRYCADCQMFRRIKDSGKRKIRTVWTCGSQLSADYELSGHRHINRIGGGGWLKAGYANCS
jgi:hypothetical protein